MRYTLTYCLLLLTLVIVGCNTPIITNKPTAVVVTRIIERDITQIKMADVVEIEVQTEVEVTRIVVPTADSTSITFWVSDNRATDIAVYEALAIRYQAINPSVLIDIVPIDSATLIQRIETAQAANRLPDLIQVSLEDALLFSAENLLDHTLATAVIKDQFGTDQFKQGILPLVAREDDTYLAVPFSATLYSLWYRSDIADLNPHDWNTVTMQSHALKRADASQYGLALPTAPNDPATAAVFEYIALSFGAEPINPQSDITFDSPEIISALDWYAKLNDSAIPSSDNGLTVREAFRDATAVMVFEQSSFLTDMSTQSGAIATSEGVDLAKHIGRIDSFISIDGTQRSMGKLTTLAFLQNADAQAADVAHYFMTDGYIDLLALDLFGKLPVLASAETAWKSQALTTSAIDSTLFNNLLDSVDSLTSWHMNPALSPVQLALLADIEREQLIGQVVHAVAVEHTLTPRQGAVFLQEQAEVLLSLRE